MFGDGLDVGGMVGDGIAENGFGVGGCGRRVRWTDWNRRQLNDGRVVL